MKTKTRHPTLTRTVPTPRAAERRPPRRARRPATLAWFDEMVAHNLDYCQRQKRAGRHVVGITCEYTPRELILAAGGIPASLCGGSAETIPAAESALPATLCPLIKSTYGFSVLRQNPFLEMAEMLVVETTCDGKKKMYELLAESRRLHVLELPQKPDDPDAFAHWRAELDKLRRVLEAAFATRITGAGLRRAIALMNRERGLRRRLAALMTAEAPPLTGRELLGLKTIVAAVPEDLARLERALRELPGRAIEPPAAGRVRVLLTGVPMPHGAERVVELIEARGGLVVCQENCTGLKPILDDVDAAAADPMEALARKYMHLPCSVMTPNTRRLDLLRRLAAEYRPDCVVEVVWHACLTYDIEAHFVRRLAERELRRPYLRLDTDYAPGDSGRIGLRLEALFETVRGTRRRAP